MTLSSKEHVVLVNGNGADLIDSDGRIVTVPKMTAHIQGRRHRAVSVFIFSSRGELIAASKSVEEIRDFIGLDSLGYLGVDDLVKATHIPREDLCLACFDGKYPVPIDDTFDKFCLEI